MTQHATGPMTALTLAMMAVLGAVSLPVGRDVQGAGPPSQTAAEPFKRRADQNVLKPFAGLVGGWRGAGQLERGRTRGAWQEKGEWAWALTRDSAALELTLKGGKFLRSAKLLPGPSKGFFRLDATLANGAKRSFVGKPATAGDGPGPLVLLADGQIKPGELKRVTITPRHDTRLLMLYEGLEEEGVGLVRLGEVGFTREGAAFAAGGSYPVCVVTEGRGTTQVSYKGKSYWVCCSGCKDLFNDDPEAILAEAAERARAKAKTKP